MPVPPNKKQQITNNQQPTLRLRGPCSSTPLTDREVEVQCRQPTTMKQRVTLTFEQGNVHTPITYRLAKDFNVAANIIRAQVAPNQIGKLVLELSGDMDELEAAVEWMRSRNIDVSLASREILIDEESCVHCGLCTGICPTEALTLDPDTFELKFLRSRCVVCEQCIPTCPVQAISTNL